MNTDDTSSEELDRHLREHFQQRYGETRQPSELWGAISPKLSLSDRAMMQTEHDVALSHDSPTLTNDPWLPLPPQKESRTVVPQAVARRPFRRMAVVASSVLAVALLLLGAAGLASMLNRQLQTGTPMQTPLAGALPTATSKSESALATPTVEATEPAGSQVFNLEPSDWLLGGNNRLAFKLVTDDATTYKGKPSAHLTANSPEVVGGATMQRLIIKPEYKGQRIRFSAYIKAQNLDMPGGLWLQVSDAQPRLPLYDDVRNRPVVGTSDWERRELVMDVPQDSESISVGALLGNQGEIWVSGAQLAVVGKDVPAMSWPPGNNFDFEQGMVGWNYGRMSLDYYTGVDAAVVHGGRLSGYVRSVALTRPSSGALLRGLPATPYAGKRLRLSAYIKSKDVEGWAGLNMNVTMPVVPAGNGPPLVPDYDNMGDQPIRGTSDWTRYGIVLDVPAKSTFIYVGLTLAGKGEVWIDDVQLEEVATSVATTGIKLVEQPQNTGFEDGLANWLVSGLLRGQYNVGVDTSMAHSGKSSASIKYTAPPPGSGVSPTPTYTLPGNGVTNSDSPFPYSLEASITRLGQSLDATQYAGKRIRLSAYFKTEGVGQYTGLWVSLVSRNSNINRLPPRDISVADAPVQGTQDWRKSEVVLDVPADVHTIGYGFGLVGDGQVWVDDMQIEVVGSDVPLTQPAATPTPAP